MIPILYDCFETSFSSMGLGLLNDCTRCVVTEEINGIYECEFDYPITGPMYQRLINFGGIVYVEHDHNGDRQAFDIYKYSAPIEGLVTFYASHVSYRLNNCIADGYIALGTPSEVLSFLDSDVDDPLDFGASPGVKFLPTATRFTFTDYSGYTSESGTFFVIASPSNFREMLMYRGEENLPSIFRGSVLQLWPGEYKFDNFAVEFYKSRGQNNGVQIRYGKNMSQVTRERDMGDIVSVVFPIWGNENGSVYAPPVYSPYVETNTGIWTTHANETMFSGTEVFYFKPAVIRAAVVNFVDQFETEPTEAQLINAAKNYMSKNSTWRANDNISVEFVDLYNSPEYQFYKSLERCSLGDFVDIYYPDLGIVSQNVEIVSATYDVLNESFIEMQLNTIRTTLAQTIIDYIGGLKK